MPAPSAIILLSGGLDSATVLALARAQGLCCLTLSFDYAQRHRAEIHAAAALSRALGAASHRTVILDPRAFAGSALTSDGVAVPRHRDAATMNREIPATYVPARNLVFLAIATATAESVGASQIHIGINAVDYSGYPDCRPEFIDAFQRAVQLGTRAGAQSHPITVQAPLARMSKAQIIRTGAALGVDFALTTSCYDPSGTPQAPLACGTCDACILRREGFATAGVPDPTRYARLAPHEPAP